jgi:hypothetical protein
MMNSEDDFRGPTIDARNDPMRTIAAIAFSLALLASPASAPANYTYAVNLSVPNTGGGEGGVVSVAGSITVDKLGTLTASDFVGYSLNFTSPDNPDILITPTNGAAVISGNVTVTATSTSLLVTIPPISSGLNEDSFQIGLPDQVHGDVRFAFFLDATDHPDLFIGNQLSLGNPKDGGTISLGPSDQTLVFVVPEPSSIALLGLGMATALGAWAVRRRDRK